MIDRDRGEWNVPYILASNTGWWAWVGPGGLQYTEKWVAFAWVHSVFLPSLQISLLSSLETSRCTWLEKRLNIPCYMFSKIRHVSRSITVFLAGSCDSSLQSPLTSWPLCLCHSAHCPSLVNRNVLNCVTEPASHVVPTAWKRAANPPSTQS